jgi:hypothetical protein
MNTAATLSRKQRIIKNSLIVMCIIFGALSVIYMWHYFATKRTITVQAEELAIQKKKETAQKIALKSDQLDLNIHSNQDITFNSNALDRKFILLIIFLASFLILFFLLIIKVYIANSIKLNLASSIIAIGIILMIIPLWYKEYAEVGKGTDHIIEKNVDSQDWAKNGAPSNAPKIYVGIYIHKLSIDIDSVSFAGYVWQKYPLAAQKTIPEGIIFPQARTCIMDQAYTIIEGGWKTVGWSIRCTLQQNFNYTQYPFDYQKIKIQLWPSTFDNKIALLPDLDSYQTLDPSASPGVNSQIHLQNWTLDRSYFSFEQEKFLTNLGYHSADNYTILGRPTQTRLPELIFYIVSDRYALSTLILLLLPILIILMLLFMVIIMAARLQFHHMLASIASLFFSYLLAYIAFKASLPIQKVVFFDYLYFIVQSAILLVSIAAVLYYKKFNIQCIQYQNMFIIRLLFWPLIASAILVISLIFFY